MNKVAGVFFAVFAGERGGNKVFSGFETGQLPSGVERGIVFFCTAFAVNFAGFIHHLKQRGIKILQTGGVAVVYLCLDGIKRGINPDPETGHVSGGSLPQDTVSAHFKAAFEKAFAVGSELHIAGTLIGVAAAGEQLGEADLFAGVKSLFFLKLNGVADPGDIGFAFDFDRLRRMIFDFPDHLRIIAGRPGGFFSLEIKRGSRIIHADGNRRFQVENGPLRRTLEHSAHLDLPD